MDPWLKWRRAVCTPMSARPVSCASIRAMLAVALVTHLGQATCHPHHPVWAWAAFPARLLLRMFARLRGRAPLFCWYTLDKFSTNTIHSCVMPLARGAGMTEESSSRHYTSNHLEVPATPAQSPSPIPGAAQRTQPRPAPHSLAPHSPARPGPSPWPSPGAPPQEARMF